jgi:hypothetical protein
MSESPEVSWQQAQEHGWFSMAADLIEQHAERLRPVDAPTNVIRLDAYRKEDK